VLTTYAGLLFRDLLDRFNGDVQKAVGAYNGGPRNPNLQYSAGVQVVANYARRILEQVADQNGRSVAEATVLVARQPPDTKKSSGKP
jgi:soluble lytic murein transglycosylase-like protein